MYSVHCCVDCLRLFKDFFTRKQRKKLSLQIMKMKSYMLSLPDEDQGCNMVKARTRVDLHSTQA
jgi:hypothetical protein